MVIFCLSPAWYPVIHVDRSVTAFGDMCVCVCVCVCVEREDASWRMFRPSKAINSMHNIGDVQSGHEA